MILVFFILGVFFGSFANVLIDRLPKGQDVVRGRSHCDYCRKTLRWYELIPLVSYAVQNGRCRRCHHVLSWQYPFIELAAGGLFAGSAYLYPAQPPVAFLYALLLIFLLVIYMSDLKYTIIPDSMVVAGILASLLFILFQPDQYPQFINRFASAVFSSTAFLLIWSLSKGKGLGFGDVKLMFLLGFITGFPLVLVTLYAGFLTGALAGVILILRGKKTVKSHIAFGPFLITGYACTVFWGKELIGYWMGYIR